MTHWDETQEKEVRLTESEVKQFLEPWQKLREAVGGVFIGMPDVVERVLICIMTGGHMLLEGVPGTAKTHLLKVVARLMDLRFNRVQFTPDLLPSDLIGTMIYNPREHTFEPKLGPVMANFVLADEINRAPAKVQSALLEAMAEHQVTVGDKTYPVPEPFFVCASQNPIEQEGTFYLPEAQKDRFMFKIHLGYLNFDEECALIRAIDGLDARVDRLAPIMGADDIIDIQKTLENLYVDPKIVDYIVSLVQASRNAAHSGAGAAAATMMTTMTTTAAATTGAGASAVAGAAGRLLDLGASPRASIALYRGARAKAFLASRAYVTPQDVAAIARDVLAHRVIPSVDAEMQSLTAYDVVDKLVDAVPQP